MVRRYSTICLVEAVSVSRLLAALLFASIALQPFPLLLICSVYIAAAISDLLDGYLARRLDAATTVGRVIDLISDKSLTVVSLLYAAARGIDLLPLAIIAAREVIVLGMRIITVNGKQVLPTSRLFGGLMALCLWGNTFVLTILGSKEESFAFINLIYWLCAAIFVLNLIARFAVNRHQIKRALRAGQ
jgi:phosphatidylglycerophosphate synthase